MKDDDFRHTPVLLQEVLDGLHLQPGGRYVDATFGRGGHSRAILQGLDGNGRLLVIDRDPEAIDAARQLAEDDSRVEVVHASFADIAARLEERNMNGQVDGILFDLGVSSPQLDNAARGFSFMRDGELDMRMDPGSGESAADWLNRAKEEDIKKILREYGEERFAGRIARKIVSTRDIEPLTRTGQLASLIDDAVPFREKDRHPATRSFQAIRIYINHELECLSQALQHMVEILKPGGRLVIISFHSLEDRMVKRFIRKQSRGDDFPQDLPVTAEQLRPKFRLIGRAVKPENDEIAANPRARSAVLRVAEKMAV